MKRNEKIATNQNAMREGYTLATQPDGPVGPLEPSPDDVSGEKPTSLEDPSGFAWFGALFVHRLSAERLRFDQTLSSASFLGVP